MRTRKLGRWAGIAAVAALGVGVALGAIPAASATTGPEAPQTPATEHDPDTAGWEQAPDPDTPGWEQEGSHGGPSVTPFTAGWE